VILHIDCNSFYASCEQAFRPNLRGKPVVVLSNNDGIIVALNKEAKAMGVKRGDAYFQVKDAIAEHGGEVCSSNYTLYADMSRRIHEILVALCPAVEPYSIDESFLFFPPMQRIAETAGSIKHAIEESTGIPVSIGIAPTKVLAKIANKLAKKGNGILDITEIDIDRTLKGYPVEDVWGIGYRTTAFLADKGVKTAFDLKRYPPHAAKKDLTIKGYYIVQELNGISMIDRIEVKAKKNIIASRSFSHLVTSLPELEEAAADYCLEAVLKMRKQRSAAKSIGVALMTNRFRNDLPQAYDNIAYTLDPPSSFAPDLVRLALKGVNAAYLPGYKYQKVMIFLSSLVPENCLQHDFFAEDKSKERSLMECFDKINSKYGSHTLFIGAQGIAKTWSMKRDFLSPNYTTSWADIPKVK